MWLAIRCRNHFSVTTFPNIDLIKVLPLRHAFFHLTAYWANQKQYWNVYGSKIRFFASYPFSHRMLIPITLMDGYHNINRVKVLECSAKDDTNITELFKASLSLSRILPAGSAENTTGLKRRSSAYVSATSKGRFFPMRCKFMHQMCCWGHNHVASMLNSIYFQQGKDELAVLR